MTAKDIYDYYTSLKEVARQGKATTPSCQGRERKMHSNIVNQLIVTTHKNWLHEIKVAFKSKSGKDWAPKAEDIKVALREAKDAFVQSVLTSQHRLGCLNPYMRRAKYIKECDSQDEMYWRCLHDENLILNVTDTPEAFQDAFLKEYLKLTPQAFRDLSEQMKQAKLSDISRENLRAELFYSCDQCMVALAAVSGWEFKKTSKGLRWGCKACYKNWDRETSKSCMIVFYYQDRKFSAFFAWPGSQRAKDECPAVHYGYEHMCIERTTYYMKYMPQSPLPDAVPTDDVASRLNLDSDTQHALLKFILKDFVTTSAEVKIVAREENQRRWVAYGPDGWGNNDTKLYMIHRVEGHGSIPEHETFKASTKAARKRAKLKN
jgi:hypothetical protein